MSVLYPSPIFGPVHSRRLGVSLGINLLPADGKMCSFDCVYCECGLNNDFRPHAPMPTREAVREGLKQKLEELAAQGVTPNVLTFAGNGEPTLHPRFAEIIDDTLALRDQYFPQAKVSVLSNATRIGRKSVFDALCKVDNNILKLDTVNPAYIRLVDCPNGRYDVQKVMERLKAFGGRCMIQTMFLKGQVGGKDVNNTGDEYVMPWLQAVEAIRPSLTMIYTIDRQTPYQSLEKATPDELDRIGKLLEAHHLNHTISY